MTQTKIYVDWENSAERWWDTARERIEDAPAALRPLLDASGTEGILVDGPEADAIRQWAESVPGWDDGPEWAREALRFDEVAAEAKEAKCLDDERVVWEAYANSEAHAAAARAGSTIMALRETYTASGDFRVYHRSESGDPEIHDDGEWYYQPNPDRFPEANGGEVYSSGYATEREALDAAEDEEATQATEAEEAKRLDDERARMRELRNSVEGVSVEIPDEDWAC